MWQVAVCDTPAAICDVAIMFWQEVLSICPNRMTRNGKYYRTADAHRLRCLGVFKWTTNRNRETANDWNSLPICLATFASCPPHVSTYCARIVRLCFFSGVFEISLLREYEYCLRRQQWECCNVLRENPRNLRVEQVYRL